MNTTKLATFQAHLLAWTSTRYGSSPLLDFPALAYTIGYRCKLRLNGRWDSSHPRASPRYFGVRAQAKMGWQFGLNEFLLSELTL